MITFGWLKSRATRGMRGTRVVGANRRTMPEDIPSPSPSANPVGVFTEAHLDASIGCGCADVGRLRVLVQTSPRRQAHSFVARASRAAVARHGAGGPLVRRAVVGRVRHRLHPGHARRGRRRPRSHTPSRSASSSRRCSPSWRSPTGRQSTRTRPAVAPISSPRKTSAPTAGLIAAASLLVDYTLTVSVSISAGVLAITSAFPRTDVYRVEMCLVFLALLMVGNLRGIRESGRIFAVPTYFFVCSISVLILAGLYHYVTGSVEPVTVPLPPGAGQAQVDDVPSADRLCERLHGDDRRRGGVERRARVSAAGVEERVGDARGDGRPRDRHVRRHHRPRARLRRHAKQRGVRRLPAGARHLRRSNRRSTTCCRRPRR